MTSLIHPTAIIHEKAKISEGTQVGPFAVIGEHVTVGSQCVVGPHVVLDGWTTVGDNTELGVGAAIGGKPQDYHYLGEETRVEIGSHCVIREYATVHRGTVKGGGVTRISDKCYIMAYGHVAHDCQLAEGVLIANGVAMAGHVTLEKYANISGLVVIHQFARIGEYSMVGGGGRVSKDIVPYAMAVGSDNMHIVNVNLVGLQRHGFTKDKINALKQAFKLLFHSELNVTQALEKIKKELTMTPEIAHLCEFIDNSTRGIIV